MLATEQGHMQEVTIGNHGCMRQDSVIGAFKY